MRAKQTMQYVRQRAIGFTTTLFQRQISPKEKNVQSGKKEKKERNMQQFKSDHN